MNSLILASLLVGLGVLMQTAQPSPATVLEFKWTKTHDKGKAVSADSKAPAPAMNDANKNLNRNARGNDPAGTRDPNLDTLDGRGAALEKSVEDATTPAKSQDAYMYVAKIQNASSKQIDILFWEYDFTDRADPTHVTRRQFLCGVNIKANKDKEVQGVTLDGPSDLVNAKSSGDASEEKVVINRIEYADGSSWMRKDWNAGEIKTAYQKAIATPWNPGEMCRQLK